MTQARQRAIWGLVIWIPLALAFVTFFFFIRTPCTCTDDRTGRVLVSLIFGIGYFTYALMLYLTRVKPTSEHLIADERDEVIGRQSVSAGMICVLVYVFVLGIGLWEFYGKAGVVPAAWMVFLAYTTSFLAFISTAVATLILQGRDVGHG